MHTEKDALKKKTPTYEFFPVGESRLYWYIASVAFVSSSIILPTRFISLTLYWLTLHRSVPPLVDPRHFCKPQKNQA